LLHAYRSFLSEYQDSVSFEKVLELTEDLNYLVEIDAESFYDTMECYYTDAVELIRRGKVESYDFGFITVFYNMMMRYNDLFMDNLKYPTDLHSGLIKDILSFESDEELRDKLENLNIEDFLKEDDDE